MITRGINNLELGCFLIFIYEFETSLRRVNFDVPRALFFKNITHICGKLIPANKLKVEILRVVKNINRKLWLRDET